MKYLAVESMTSVNRILGEIDNSSNKHATACSVGGTKMMSIPFTSNGSRLMCRHILQYVYL